MGEFTPEKQHAAITKSPDQSFAQRIKDIIFGCPHVVTGLCKTDDGFLRWMLGGEKKECLIDQSKIYEPCGEGPPEDDLPAHIIQYLDTEATPPCFYLRNTKTGNWFSPQELKGN